MKLRLIAAAVAAMLLTVGTAVAQDTSTEKGKLSYALGYDHGLNLAELAASGEQLDPAAVAKGLQDAMAKKNTAVPEDQLRPVFEAFQKRQVARAQKAKSDWEKASAENKTKSETFLAQNKGKSGVKVLAGPSGTQYRVIENGTGAKPSQASTIQIEVLGPFPWGQRPATPRPATQNTMKVSEVSMPAMREVLLQMPAGSKWEVTLPPAVAFGDNPRTGYPPNVALQYEVKLVSVK